MGVKKILVLDVDETLLNIEPLFFLEKFKKNYLDYNGVLLNLFKKDYYLVPRPRLVEMLESVNNNFTLVAYSVVQRDITEKKLKLLGVKDYFSKIYGSEDLVNKKKSFDIISKDFSVPVKDIIAIDDKPETFHDNSSVISVKPFFMGRNTDYEYSEFNDNLMGAAGLALNIK